MSWLQWARVALWFRHAAYRLALVYSATKVDTAPAARNKTRDDRMKNIARFYVDNERELAGYIQAERKARKLARRS